VVGRARLIGRGTGGAGRPGARRSALALVALGLLAGLPAPDGGPPARGATASAPVPVPPGARQVPAAVGAPPLTGTLTLPAGAGPFPAVVLVSGSGPNDQDETIGPNHPFRDIALGLAARGIASVRYDKRTRDDPTSIDPRTFTPTQEYVPDALAAIRLLRRTHGVDSRRIFVLGHSLGGTYAPLIATRAPAVRGVILLAAGAEPLGAAFRRQVRYLSTLPGAIGAQARAQLPEVTRLAAEITDPAALAEADPATRFPGGVGPAYYLSELRYDELATARALRRPILLLQGERDYQVTPRDDLARWIRALRGRRDVRVVRVPGADHLFLDGSGPPTPQEYGRPGQVDPAAIAAIASWVRTR
jgi:uncharacterized protein